VKAVTDLCFALVSSELGWFTDGSYTAIVLGNYDLPGASAIYRKLMEFLAAQ
jgi:hypothetical protein